ncbi:hypothetical protein HMPREF9120_00939, partial [Neisseria sp. oral taxon 020 str. F0370]|uniref:DUF927 domain-containing protein n=1 Tax=Neisseria sp. oral taxon 020 TaxID=712401 RepID=UPI0002A2C6A6
ECKSSGVYYIHTETDKDGRIIEKPPLRLSDQIDIIGRGIDAAGGHYRIIRWRDAHTRRTAALACADIGTPQSWQRLQGCGITILSGRRKRELLADYLQTGGATTPYTVADKAGWQGSAYILPNGEIVNQTSEKVIYNGTGGQAYTEAGGLKDWQDNIARYAAGNSRLLLALGTSLSAPLLHILHEAGGGFHICGDSSDGKTTAALVGLSVWGQPQTLKKTWRGTDLGFSNFALERNDGFLVLDEIGEAGPKTVSKTAYSVINGTSKAQGAKDGGNRPDQEWLILLFSTGEYSMQAYMERAGEPWEAGQAVRLPSVSAAARYGIYDTLHGFANGATLSDHLQQAAAQYHGTAARAWLAKLQTLSADTVRAAQAAFLSTLPDLDGQAARVARRFALAAAALELSAEITGLPAGIGTAGIKQCFEDWFAANDVGKHEDRQIIRSMAAFMQQHAHGMRFADWHSEYTNRDHAGYRREGEPNEKAEYWIIPAVFEGEILQGKDTKKSLHRTARHRVAVQAVRRQTLAIQKIQQRPLLRPTWRRAARFRQPRVKAV